MMADNERDWIDEIGEPAYDAIAEMVAAMQCDYDRLEELLEIRDDADGGGHSVDDDDIEELSDLEESAGDCGSLDEAIDQIMDDPLSLQIFGEHSNGEWEATSYELLLTTGGPAVRIVGGLCDGEAQSAQLEVQDWFKPWSEYTSADPAVLLSYVNCFCFVIPS